VATTWTTAWRGDELFIVVNVVEPENENFRAYVVVRRDSAAREG
jgi:hypothetical protein